MDKVTIAIDRSDIQPVLPYPEGYCHQCGEHILETDLFGIVGPRNDMLLCAGCWTPVIEEHTENYARKKWRQARSISSAWLP